MEDFSVPLAGLYTTYSYSVFIHISFLHTMHVLLCNELRTDITVPLAGFTVLDLPRQPFAA